MKKVDFGGGIGATWEDSKYILVGNEQNNNLNYIDINNFTISNTRTKSTDSVVINSPTILIDVEENPFYHFLIGCLGQYFALKNEINDLRVVFISFRERNSDGPQRSEWLSESIRQSKIDVFSDGKILEAIKFKKIVFKNLIIVPNGLSHFINGNFMNELIPEEAWGNNVTNMLKSSYLKPAFLDLGNFISRMSNGRKLDTSHHDKDIFIFPKSTFDRISEEYKWIRYAEENGLTLAKDNSSLVDPNNVLPLILHNTSLQGDFLTFLKRTLFYKDEILTRYISEDSISKLYNFFIDAGYHIVNDTDITWHEMINLVYHSRRLAIVAGSSLIWTGVQKNKNFILIDPYDEGYEFPHTTIIKTIYDANDYFLCVDKDYEKAPGIDVIVDRLSAYHDGIKEISMHFNIIIPMAGQGSRFKSQGINTPKPLIEVNNKTLAQRSIESLGLLGNFIFITRTFDNPSDNDVLEGIFNKTTRKHINIVMDVEHKGAAHSASFAESAIDPTLPLIVTNCDQQMYWDANKFKQFIKDNDPDGAIVVTKSQDPKNSYAIFNEAGVVGHIAEKRVISDYALTGIHYWKNPDDFFDSFRDAFLSYEENGYPECYVSITYNELIRMGKKIMVYIIEPDEFVPLGVPEQVAEFVER